ncbi:GNAT family N-acetyltransferase [uncultured Dokdonia sp.]|uniref:GNAT family N-acetyltransferase n=1 Tax=uncultured Dokdonia sp. TaxID=575653 RepID=UPI002637E5C3|nr:GNAT family N-acetyltransferase [uncultured Dokdonia sp.]
MIEHAKISEITEILSLTKACAAFMISKGIYQWNEHYPSKEAFEKDIERNELYVLKLENKIVGTIVISTYMDDEYTEVDWLSPNKNNIYIHRLAVHPSFQKQGYAVQLMEYAEAFAKANKFTSVRLDTFSQNARNQKFYEQRGYKRLGNIYFPKQSKYPFYCYELLLK